MRIFCVGRNYEAHAHELGNAVPKVPVIFMKPRSALLTTSVLSYPEFTNDLQYETELVLKICRNGRYIEPSQASFYYNAITVGIDFTARDVQQRLKEKGLPWEKSKSWDGSAVIGTWHKFSKQIEKKGPFAFSMKKNGETAQSSSSQEMLFSFEKIITEITRYFAINIGDLIFTGTPSGVAECVVGDNLEGYLGAMSVFNVKII